MHFVLRTFCLSLLLQSQAPPTSLPAGAAAQGEASIAASRPHRRHVWRDTPPYHADGRLNGYVEISRGGRRKYEFDMRANRLRIDRMMPPELAYPVNYGFVPQTVSYDGDPFDVLVLGPAIPSGTLVRGAIVGAMHMEDEKGLDTKVVISPLDAAGKPRFALTAADRDRIGRFFDIYKRHEPGKFSRVTGWAGADDGAAFVRQTHRFFVESSKREVRSSK